MIAFSAEVYFRLVAAYVAALWPVVIVLCGLGLVVVWLVLRPRPGGDRFVAAVLAAAWLWTGAVFHAVFFAGIYFAAPVLAGAFVLQGLLLLWTGVVRGRLSCRFRRDAAGSAGLACVAAAVIVWPLADGALGFGWDAVRPLMAAPAPLTLYTLGLLLLARPRPPLHLAVIPCLWAVAGALAANELDVPQDLALPVAAAAVLALAVRRLCRRPPPVL